MSRIKKIIFDWNNLNSNSKLTRVPHKIAVNTLVRQCRQYVGLAPKSLLLCHDGDNLHPSVHHYLSNCGLTVHSLFGSQDSGLVLGNIPRRFCKLGTVGKQLPGVDIKMEKLEKESCDGEACDDEFQVSVRSRSGYMGLINRDTDTDDEWIVMKSSVSVDAEGFVNIHHNEQQELYDRVETR